jgi:hypothetical protein
LCVCAAGRLAVPDLVDQVFGGNQLPGFEHQMGKEHALLGTAERQPRFSVGDLQGSQ